MVGVAVAVAVAVVVVVVVVVQSPSVIHRPLQKMRRSRWNVCKNICGKLLLLRSTQNICINLF